MSAVSRRQFLKYLGAGAIGLAGWPRVPLAAKKRSLLASNVVQCFDENATSGSVLNESIVQTMMDESIKTLAGLTDLGEAWKSVFPGITENSVISIKVNCINSSVPTNPELVNCIVNGLAQMEFGGANYKRNNMIVWDRSDGELSSSGYTIYDGDDSNTVRCFGSGHSGVGYDDTCTLYVAGSNTRPSKILSTMSDYLINVAVLKNHGTARVTLSMKNHYGSVSPVPSHGNQCDPGIPSLNQQIRDVVAPHNIQKIFVIDALWGSVLSGPGGSANCNPKKLIMSLDTVACDCHGQSIVNEERVVLGYSTVDASHITTASQPPYDLGTTDINLIEINNPTNVEESKVAEAEDDGFRVSPNPFSRRTTVELSISGASSVYLDLIDSAGRFETSIYKGQLPKGQHRIDCCTDKRLASGTYFLRLHSQGRTRIRKVTVLN